MKALLSILAVPILISCQHRPAQTFPRLSVSNVDTVVKVSTNHMIQSGAPALQVNFKTDTTVIYARYSDDIRFKNSRRIVDDPQVADPQATGLKIFVDTSYAFQAKGFLYQYEAFPDFYSFQDVEAYDAKVDALFSKEKRLKNTYVSAHPVLLYNGGDKDLYVYVGTYEEFKFIQEAVDTDGKWKPIEFWTTLPSCIGGDLYFVIAPKHYAASAVVKYHGNFETQLRVKLQTGGKTYYSNSFFGRINRSQFNQDFVKEEAKHWHMHSLRSEHVTEEHIARKKRFIFLEPLN